MLLAHFRFMGTMTRTLVIAAAQYPLEALSDFPAYEAKITRWVEDAVRQGAELLVFPEYGGAELAYLHGGGGDDIPALINHLTACSADWDVLHQRLATRFGVTIVSGSMPVRRGASLVLNRASIFGPTGKAGEYFKIMPTPWERDTLHMAGERTLRVFDVGTAKIGLLICYDIEFPLLSRALAEAGADVILAPSNTETAWGYWRVRTGAAARALENQLYTVHAPTVGEAHGHPLCPANAGAAAIFAPSDAGFPPGGLLAIGEMNTPQWLVHRVDLDLVRALRQTGGVMTYAHWPEQPGASALPKAELVQLI